MKTIPLTQGKVALVDDADYAHLHQYKWQALQCRYSFYARRTIRVAGGNKKMMQMHRVILGLHAGNGLQCDHIDGNGLNNQRSNLRICTITENNRAARKQKILSSKYKGVSWDSRDRKWRSCIMVNKRNKSLGYFDLEADAAKAYNRAALRYFGEFAITNNITPESFRRYAHPGRPFRPAARGRSAHNYPDFEGG